MRLTGCLTPVLLAGGILACLQKRGTPTSPECPARERRWHGETSHHGVAGLGTCRLSTATCPSAIIQCLPSQARALMPDIRAALQSGLAGSHTIELNLRELKR
jgi:hypothetical protein